MTVREATAADGGRIAELRRQADRAHARLMPGFFRSPPLDWSPPLAVGPHAVALVAVEAARVVGYVAARIVDTPADPTMTPRRRAYVEAVVVDEAARRRGFGSVLMHAAADWARRRDAAEIVLTVWADNAAADALYHKLGYGPVARVLSRPL